MRAPACACIHSECLSSSSDLSFKLCSYCLLQCWGLPWGLAHARKHAATDSAPAFKCWFLTLILFVCECFARMYVCVPCLCRIRGVHMETLDTMKLGFQTRVSCHVSAENWTWLLCHSKKCCNHQAKIVPFLGGRELSLYEYFLFSSNSARCL